ncbi:MAG: lactate permease LctP family transporter [Candidatus Bathyarchaeia archaeon]
MDIWVQPIDPLGGLPLSFLIALTPILLLILLLCSFKMPGWKAALISSITCFIVSLVVYKPPIQVALLSYIYGLLFGIWPISWIVLNAMFLYEVSEKCGCVKSLSDWMKNSLPNDRGLYALLISFLFCGLIEGVDGYGFPIAMSSTLLISLGFKPLDAVCISLIANTVTVPFASLGVPIETLGMASGLDVREICLPLSSHLTLISVITAPFIVYMASESRAKRKVYETSIIAGASLGVSIYLVSIYLEPRLSGILAPLFSILLTMVYVRVRLGARIKSVGFKGWLPWIIVSILMGVTGFRELRRSLSVKMYVPGLHEKVFIPLYGSTHSAVYEFQPLAHGTLALISALIVACIFSLKPSATLKLYIGTWRRMKCTFLTIAEILGLAFLMNYTGLSLTLGYALSYVGPLFPILSGFIGWIGTFVSGSETGSNALFGNLQRIVAVRCGLSPYLTASLNAAGGVLGKIISLQSITIGLSAAGLRGEEGTIMRRLIGYSLTLTLILGLTAYLQAYFLIY